MVGDTFTKPLQGATFRKFRAAVLNLENEAGSAQQASAVPSHRSVLKQDSTSTRDRKTTDRSKILDAHAGNVIPHGIPHGKQVTIFGQGKSKDKTGNLFGEGKIDPAEVKRTSSS